MKESNVVKWKKKLVAILESHDMANMLLDTGHIDWDHCFEGKKYLLLGPSVDGYPYGIHNLYADVKALEKDIDMFQHVNVEIWDLETLKKKSFMVSRKLTLTIWKDR